MTQFVQLVISGLMLGSIYGLLAMGFVIVFKATNVVNFAHASVVMLGAYLVAKWHDSLGFFGAIGAAAVACRLRSASGPAPGGGRRRRARSCRRSWPRPDGSGRCRDGPSTA